MSQKPLARNAPDATKRRNIIIAAVVAVAVVAAAIVIIAGSGGSDSKTSASSSGSVQGTKEVSALLDGIPQKGNTLGKATAPVTVREFIDYQCPFCKAYSLGPYAEIVNKYVRTGKVRWVFEPLTFIGPDSEKAARAAAAAGQQNRQANFTDLWYFNQGQENSGYATDQFIDKIYDAAGVDKAKANAYRRTPASKSQSAEAQTGSEDFGVNSTPSFVLGKTGTQDFQKVDVGLDSADSLAAALDTLLK